MNIVRTSGEDWIGIILPGTHKGTGNDLGSFGIEMTANVAKDMAV
jgi:hypothetical protein